MPIGAEAKTPEISLKIEDPLLLQRAEAIISQDDVLQFYIKGVDLNELKELEFQIESNGQSYPVFRRSASSCRQIDIGAICSLPISDLMIFWQQSGANIIAGNTWKISVELVKSNAEKITAGHIEDIAFVTEEAKSTKARYFTLKEIVAVLAALASLALLLYPKYQHVKVFAIFAFIISLGVALLPFVF